ncbi:MAG: hypothetical protein OSB25_09370 [Salibacteraceae bacterium]|nr:hypothetical protein [Salibacteraceae bacterium]|tara:strand:+ start:9518 stop:10417 length:900 start_codon:yes stop_codon:yes gene_type:complete
MLHSKRFKYTHLFLGILAISLLTIGCKKGDVGDLSDRPVYLKIDDIMVSGNSQVYGEGTDQITDAWVYVDDKQIGVFELPCEVPVLLSGSRNIKVFGGIKQSGITSQRSQYMFYSPYSLDTLLTEEETIQLNPVVAYSSTTQVPWKEDFEDVSTLLDSTTNSRVAIVRLKDPSIVRTGLYVGAINLTTETPSAQIYTVDKIDIPKFVESYMEIDYKSNVTIKVLITAYLRTGLVRSVELINIKASDDLGGNGWKKMYIFLAPILESVPDAVDYRIFIETALPIGRQSGYVYIDNMKIVH